MDESDPDRELQLHGRIPVQLASGTEILGLYDWSGDLLGSGRIEAYEVGLGRTTLHAILATSRRGRVQTAKVFSGRAERTVFFDDGNVIQRWLEDGEQVKIAFEDRALP